MDQVKFGKFIKAIRKQHNMTQKQFAEKYHVTYQAVSKWENGLNMPDMVLIKQISEDFNISVDELLAGEYKKDKPKPKSLFMISALAVIAVIGLVALMLHCFGNSDFQFKILTTECDNFKISGNISYNENKSAVYITNIIYCGGNDSETYQSIECALYETNHHVENKIGSYQSQKGNITLEEFLKDVTISVDNYETICDEYQEDSLYLTINATDDHEKTTIYKIPLKLDSCPIS